MNIKEVFDGAIKNNDVDLQALIMFLVFEKQVLDMDDLSDELDLYFLPKHQERMNDELTKYKNKMMMKKTADVFKVFTKQKETAYILADDEKQASAYTISIGLTPTKIELQSGLEMMYFMDEFLTLDDIAKDQDAPCCLGTNNTEWRH